MSAEKKMCEAAKERQAGPRFLRIADVVYLTGLPPSSVYERMAAGKFPKSIPLGPDARVRAWIEADVIEWQENLIKEAKKAAR